MKFNNFLIFSIVLIVLCGCKNEKGKTYDPIVAQVIRKTLTLSELREAIPLPSDKKDSAILAKDYIDSWIKQQLLVAEAESKLTPKEQKLDLEIEQYRQELLIHKYKENIMQGIINQPVPKSEVEKYYRKNLNKFILTSPIVKVKYVIFPAGIVVPENILELLQSNKVTDVEKCEDYIFKSAKKYDDFEGNWIYFENLLNSVNYLVPDYDDFLKNQKIIEKRINKELHVIVITSYYATGNQAPIEFVAPQIRGAVIINKKLDFLREIKDSLYKDALKYNKFRVFN